MLKDWHPNLRKCKAIYHDWYADEVKDVRLQFKLTEHKCAVTQTRFLWTTYEGSTCPANIKVFSDTCAVDERIQAYRSACQPFVIHINPNILHVSESFYQMYMEMANSDGKDAGLHLQELYASRTPKGYDLVAQKHSLEKELAEVHAENGRLKEDLEEKIEHNRQLNVLSDEYNVTIYEMSKQISNLNYSLGQFKNALSERDNIIRTQQQRPYYNVLH